MAPFYAQYFCPLQGQFWQGNGEPIATFESARNWADVLKPPAGNARVIDCRGVVYYQI
jgi:hypothetical protein